MKRLTAVALCLGAAALAGGCMKPAAPDLTVQQFMARKVDPASKVYFSSVQYISDETGNHDIKPETDADWAKVQQSAVDLQAYGKALQTPGYTEGRNPDWTTFSQSLVEISQQAETAAKAKDPDKVFEVSGTIYAVCDACHMAYPKDSKTPGGGSAS
ncbi:MAG: hypothetical protein ABIP41_00345 [Croceibacterium sp.]